jgi:YesN/AraC family two-component response regulator
MPDITITITDGRMPRMDGLDLSRLAAEQLE